MNCVYCGNRKTAYGERVRSYRGVPYHYECVGKLGDSTTLATAPAGLASWWHLWRWGNLNAVMKGGAYWDGRIVPGGALVAE